MQERVPLQHSPVPYPGMLATFLMMQRLAKYTLSSDSMQCLEKVPCKQDVFSIIRIQPGGKDWEGLAAFTEGRLEAEAAQTGSCCPHTGFSTITMVHIEVQQSHPLDACTGNCLFTRCAYTVKPCLCICTAEQH